VARHKVNLALIRDNWPDMVRLAGSLMAHKVKASEVMRVTQGDGRPTTLGRALADYGRIAKTLHLLAWVDDPAYHRTGLWRFFQPSPVGLRRDHAQDHCRRHC